MAHRADGLNDIFEHDVTVRDNLKVGNNLKVGDDISLEFGDLVSEQNPDAVDAIRIKATASDVDIVLGDVTGYFSVWNVADNNAVFYVDNLGNTDIAGDLTVVDDATIRYLGLGGHAAGATYPLDVTGQGRCSGFFFSALGTLLGVTASGLILRVPGIDPLPHIEVGTATNAVTLTNFNARNQDHGHGNQSDPTLFIHSNTVPSIIKTEWMSLAQDQSDGQIRTGIGGIQVGEKTKMTRLGGFAILLTNKTGRNTVKGQLVQTDTSIDDAFDVVAASGDDCIGIVLDVGVSDGSEAWVVVGGIADVLIDAGGSTRGDRLITSATPGSADVWNVGGAVATHFQEIGHCIQTRIGAGLARAVLHFN